MVGLWIMLSDLLMVRAFYEQDQLKSSKRVSTSGVETGMARVGSMVFPRQMTHVYRML